MQLHSTPSMARPSLNNFRRIVVKVGSSLLVDSDAGEVRASWLSALADDVAKLHKAGREVRSSRRARLRSAAAA